MDNFCVFPAANNQLSLLQMVLLSFYKTSEVNELYPRYRYVKARSICYNSTNVLPIYEMCLYIQNWFAFFLSRICATNPGRFFGIFISFEWYLPPHEKWIFQTWVHFKGDSTVSHVWLDPEYHSIPSLIGLQLIFIGRERDIMI